MLSQNQKDDIYNALVVGMTLEDAYLYAGLTEAQIAEASSDPQQQVEWHKLTKHLEFSLLQRMNDISEKQMHMGKEAATAWMLEHLFPRYSKAPRQDLGEIHVHMDTTDPATLDTVEVFSGRNIRGDE